MKIMIRLGEYDELLIDVEDIASIEGIADSVAGHIRLNKDGQPRWVSTRIGLKSGGSHLVPQLHDEVEARLFAAGEQARVAVQTA